MLCPVQMSKVLVSSLVIVMTCIKECGQEGISYQRPTSVQVDRKFVPLVCGSQLAIMDQHAADERVQLERLTAQVRDLP